MTSPASGTRAAAGSRLPVPTHRALGLLGAGLILALLAGAAPALGRVLVGWNLLVLALLLVDLWRAPRPSSIRAARHLPSPMHLGVEETVTLTLEGPPQLSGVVRDTPPSALVSRGHQQPIPAGSRRRSLTYRVRADTSGSFAFGALHLRVHGPLGLMQRQIAVPLSATGEARPDVRALSAEALHLTRAHAAESRRRRLTQAPGQTFHSLREYRPGEDARGIDWKATARRAEPIVRVRRPEQHQPILLLVDCGRHMAGRTGERRRLDVAVEAALRVAAASLSAGDRVGLVAYAGGLLAHVPPRGGPAHLKPLSDALVGLEARFEESDHGRAIQTALSRNHRRALLVFFTDLLDAASAQPLVEHIRRIGHRHLPLIATLQDASLRALAHGIPDGPDAAYQRHAAGRMSRELDETLQQVRRSGAHVVHAPPESFGIGSVNAYLDLKARGAL